MYVICKWYKWGGAKVQGDAQKYNLVCFLFSSTNYCKYLVYSFINLVYIYFLHIFAFIIYVGCCKGFKVRKVIPMLWHTANFPWAKLNTLGCNSSVKPHHACITGKRNIYCAFRPCIVFLQLFINLIKIQFSRACSFIVIYKIDNINYLNELKAH